MSIPFEIHSIDQWDVVADSITQCHYHSIIAFYGGMGAGKTTLIRALCQSLGSVDQVNSPTFSIVNEYLSSQCKIYHFDFYRIKNEVELYDLGYEDYFYSGDVCLIEWPEKVKDLLPSHHRVIIERKDQERRTVIFD